jgi:hypothetical protein
MEIIPRDCLSVGRYENGSAVVCARLILRILAVEIRSGTPAPPRLRDPRIPAGLPSGGLVVAGCRGSTYTKCHGMRDGMVIQCRRRCPPLRALCAVNVQCGSSVLHVERPGVPMCVCVLPAWPRRVMATITHAATSRRLSWLAAMVVCSTVCGSVTLGLPIFQFRNCSRSWETAAP